MITNNLRTTTSLLLILLVAAALATPARGAARPSVAQALELRPLQAGVTPDVPTADQIDKCSVKSEAKKGVSGWIVVNGAGQTLRRFLDTNGDNKVDLWAYYQDGIEIYRDLDADFDGKADQYRWLATAGTRWGLDPDEDGRINTWKVISPEEVTAEVVAAFRDKDARRFQILLPTREEVESLGLGEKQLQDLTNRIESARTGFAAAAGSQKIVGPQTQWLQFGATRPGVFPAGTEGSTRDVVVYDNVAAIVDTDGKNGQLIVGTLIQVGSGWRVMDLPKSEAGDSFFTAILQVPQSEDTVQGGLDQKMQSLLSDLETTDKALLTAPGENRAKLHQKRADILEQIAAESATDSERQTWTRQFIDTISAAVQQQEYPQGIDRLKALCDRLATGPDAGGMLPHARFAFLSASYTTQLSQPNVDFTKVQEQWLKDLEAFVAEYPRAAESAEAMLQLAIAEEFTGRDEEAIRWFTRILTEFADSPLAVKAAGAKRRLESVGKSISLRGKTLAGTAVDLDQLRGRVVLIHYWATWCEPCKRDLQTLKTLQAKYGKAGFSLIGVSLDSDVRALDQYVRAQQIAWPQLHEPGGLDSPLANELGILTLPTMILVDKTGRVVRRNVHSAELEEELQKLTK